MEITPEETRILEVWLHSDVSLLDRANQLFEERKTNIEEFNLWKNSIKNGKKLNYDMRNLIEFLNMTLLYDRT